nr:hypothetical protein [uncultured Methanolobus sp.]
MDILDAESGRIKDIYAHFGLAVYFSQCIERTISISLVTVFNIDVKNMTREKYDYELGHNFKKTLGSLLNEVQKSKAIDENFQAELFEVLDKRNWITHHYFWDRAIQMMSEEGQLSMIDELREIADRFQKIDTQLMEVLQDWRRIKGISDEIVEEILQDLISKKIQY